jgi:hypothetical protein
MKKHAVMSLLCLFRYMYFLLLLAGVMKNIDLAWSPVLTPGVPEWAQTIQAIAAIETGLPIVHPPSHGVALASGSAGLAIYYAYRILTKTGDQQ